MIPTVAFLSLGGPEMIWIFVLMLVLFGAKKLPGLARSIGEGLGQFKSARDEFERELRYAELDAVREEEEKAPKIEAPKEGRLEIGSSDDDVKDEYAHDDYHHDDYHHDYHHDYHNDGHDHDQHDHTAVDAEHRDEAQSDVLASSEEEQATTAATSTSPSNAS